MSCYNKLGDNHSALKAINKSIDFDPIYAKGYYKRAELNCKLEDYETAERDYRKAQDLDKSLNLLGKINEISKKANKAKIKDYYKILGITKSATEDEIKKAFRKLSLKHHPDRHTEPQDKEIAEKKYKEINEAYGVLKDPKKKKEYDCGMHDFDSIGGMPGNNMNFNNYQNFNTSSKTGNNGFNSGGIPPEFMKFFHQSNNFEHGGFSNFGGKRSFGIFEGMNGGSDMFSNIFEKFNMGDFDGECGIFDKKMKNNGFANNRTSFKSKA